MGPSGHREGKSVPCLSPSFWQLAGNLWCSLTYRWHSPWVFSLSSNRMCLSLRGILFMRTPVRGGASGKEPACRCRWLEMQVWSLGQEDPLEEERATHSDILAWRIPIDRGAWWATVHGVPQSWMQLSDLACSRHSDREHPCFSMTSS